MSKTITIEDDLYETLVGLKRPGETFTRMLRRHLIVPAQNNKELLNWHESQPPPQIDLKVLDVIKKGRGRRSGRRR